MLTFAASLQAGQRALPQAGRRVLPRQGRYRGRVARST